MSHVLAAVSHWIEQTSLRRTAKEIGLSPSGLRKVLAGSSLHSSTVRKLESWYIRNRDQLGEEGELDRETAEAALRLLTEAAPPGKRDHLVRTFLSQLERDCREAGLPVPAWVDDLRKDRQDDG